MWGRVMAILLTIVLGGTPIGAPYVGWLADRFGPRWALGLGAAGCMAALVGLTNLIRYRHLRLRVTLDGVTPPATSGQAASRPPGST